MSSKNLTRFFFVLISLLAYNKGNTQCTFDSLYIPPDSAEMQEVLHIWDQRDMGVYDWQVNLDTIINNQRHLIVSHKIENSRHYGLIRFPGSVASAGNCPEPALVLFHGGISGFSMNHLNNLSYFLPDPLLNDSLIIIVPSYRSESIDLGNNKIFNSEGPSTEIDKDADDVLVLLEAIIQNTNYIDTNRISGIGFSRGANTASKAGIRSDRFKRLMLFFGPYDYFNQGMMAQTISNYQFQLGPPSIAYHLLYEGIGDYCNGLISMHDLRIKILSWSGGYFANLLPPTLIFHGMLDQIVPIENAYFLDSVMNSLNLEEDYFHLYTYPLSGHGLFGFSGADTVCSNAIREVITPELSWQNNTLKFDNSSGTYQWYLNGNPIPGANSKEIIPEQSGLYQLEIINSTNCSYFSAEYNVILNQIIQAEIRKDYFFADTENHLIKSRIATSYDAFYLYNYEGKCLDSLLTKGSFPIRFRFSNSDSGIYLARIMVNGRWHHLKFFMN